MSLLPNWLVITGILNIELNDFAGSDRGLQPELNSRVGGAPSSPSVKYVADLECTRELERSAVQYWGTAPKIPITDANALLLSIQRRLHGVWTNR